MVITTTCGNRREGKTGRKNAARSKKAVSKSSAVEPIDTQAIDNALKVYQKRDPTQPRRGRKPVREDIYITESLAKIEMMEKRLAEEKNTLSSKERDELRNKASALRSRVNRKLEHKSFLQTLDVFKA